MDPIGIYSKIPFDSERQSSLLHGKLDNGLDGLPKIIFYDSFRDLERFSVPVNIFGKFNNNNTDTNCTGSNVLD